MLSSFIPVLKAKNKVVFMKIKDLPRVDRPREKLLRYGPRKLNNSELVAIILGSGQKGENAIDLAKKLLRKFPNSQLSNTSIKHLIEVPGIGKTKAGQIVACFELGKRLLKNKRFKLVLSPKDVWNELQDVRGNKKEYFIIFYLDIGNQIIKKETVSIGNLNTSIVHPREVFEPAITNFAAQIIIAHNHPSGNDRPSEEDIALTQKLIKAGEILGIEVVDHVIVTTSHYFSFKEKGLIKIND